MASPDSEPLAGRLFVSNQTPYDIEVAWLNEIDAADARVVRTVVKAAQTSDVGQTDLPAAWEVELDLVIVVDVADGVTGVDRIRRKARVAVDGDVVVAVRLTDSQDPFSVVVEAMPAP